jgi:hypothetical protein
MLAAIFALALQATNAAPAPAPAPAPSRNAADGIGDILAQTPPDEPAPPPAAAPAPPAPAAAASAPPPPIAPPVVSAPAPAAPPEPPPPNPGVSLYESDVRSTFQAREARQGPLDGRWTLSDADGKGLYMFQFSDPGPGRGPVEGAWRDLGRQGAVDSSGFIARADRSGQGLVLRFEGKPSWVVTLTLGADGRWIGRMQTADQTRPVVMTRS